MFSIHLSVFRTIGVFRTFEHFPECYWKITVVLDLRRGRKGRRMTTTMKSVWFAVTCSSVSHVIFGGRRLASSCGSMDFRLSLLSFSFRTPSDPLPPPPLLSCPSPSFPQLLRFSSYVSSYLLYSLHAPAPLPPQNESTRWCLINGPGLEATTTWRGQVIRILNMAKWQPVFWKMYSMVCTLNPIFHLSVSVNFRRELRTNLTSYAGFGQQIWTSFAYCRLSLKVRGVIVFQSGSADFEFRSDVVYLWLHEQSISINKDFHLSEYINISNLLDICKDLSESSIPSLKKTVRGKKYLRFGVLFFTILRTWAEKS